MVTNKSFENVAKFRHFGMALTNQNCIQEGKNMRLSVESAYYHAVQNLLYFCWLFEDVKIKIYSRLCCMGLKLGLSC
jgi:hypothetical protein